MHLKRKKDLTKAELTDEPLQDILKAHQMEPDLPSNLVHKKKKIYLAEVACVLIIIGGLACLVLPSLLDCSTSARLAEAKQLIGSRNRAQQAYFAENGTFTDSSEKLGIGFKTETSNYRYSMRVTNSAVFNYAIARQDKVRIYSSVGAVFSVPSTSANLKAAKNEMATVEIICINDSPGKSKPAEPTYQNGVLACGAHTHASK